MANDITLEPKLITLADEAATLACGAHFSCILQPGLNIYLHGDLGAGKTTFVRGVLRGLGYEGKVKSPTYNLVELYNIFNYQMYHFDLYRFNSEDEWHAAGFGDYFNAQSICMIEWPEKAAHVLPEPDIHVKLSIFNESRKIQFSASTILGNACLEKY